MSLEVVLRGTCDQTRLLDLVENFTLFSEHKAGLVKILGQNHQFLGVNKAITSMLTEEELVIFDILTRPAPELSADERAEVKKVATLLLDRIKALLVLNWRQKSTARSQLKLTIEDVLDTGLPRAYDKPLYAQKCSALFEHIYESYPERDAGVYAAAV